MYKLTLIHCKLTCLLSPRADNHSFFFLFLFTLLLTVISSTTAAACSQKSTFKSSDEGWRIAGDAQGEHDAPDWSAGQISAVDNGDGRWWYFAAPKIWTGNKSCTLWGTLTFELNELQGGSAAFNGHIVQLISGDKVLQWSPDIAPPAKGWVRFDVPLFSTDRWSFAGKPVSDDIFFDVLSSLDALLIRGEYVTGSDAAALRSVRMTPGDFSPWLLTLLSVIVLAGAAILANKKLQKEKENEFKEPGIHVKVTFPGLKKSEGTGGFALPADSFEKNDKRPTGRFDILVMERKEDKLHLAPDGTEITLSVKNANSGTNFPISKADIELKGQTQGLQASAKTIGGKIVGKLRCGPSELEGKNYLAAPAERWKLGTQGIEYSQAATFEITAKAADGTSGKCIVEIIAGAPHAMELVGAPEVTGVTTALLKGPDGKAPKVGESLIAVTGMRFMVATIPKPMLRIQRKKRMIRFGGWAKSGVLENTAGTKKVLPIEFVKDVTGSASVPATTALVGMLALVTDKAGNPIPLPRHGARAKNQPTLRFPRTKSSGSQALPYVMSADEPGKPGDPKNTRWACGWVTPFPQNAFLAFLAPCYAVDGGAETDVEVSIGKAAWRFRVTVEPTTDSAKLNHWFVSGDIPSKEYFLGEIALALVPFIGDGRDLVIYGIKFIHDEQLTGIDHAVAVLSLAGLVLDIVPVAIKFNIAAASAKAAVKLLRKIPEKPAKQLAKAISEHLAKGVSDIDDLSKLKKLADSKEFTKYKESILQLGHLGEAIKKAENLKIAQRLLTVMGLVVLTIGLAPLLEILAKRSVEEAIDLLEGLHALDKRESL